MTYNTYFETPPGMRQNYFVCFFIVLQFKLEEGLVLAENSKKAMDQFYVQCHSNRIPLHLVRVKGLMNENLTFLRV